MKITLFKKHQSRTINVENLDLLTLIKRFEKIKVPLSPKHFPDLKWYEVKDFFWANEHPVMKNAKIAFDGPILYVYSSLTDLFVFSRNNNTFDPGKNNVLKIFQDIALPYIKDFFEAKALKILEICKTSTRECYIDEDIGVIVKARKNHTLTIISHMDLIKPFYKGFWLNKTLIVDPKTNIIKGALDNTITNAAVIDLLLSGNIPPNVELVFTNDEETGMRASQTYVFKNKGVSYINLDITNEFKNKSVSIEYDCPSAKTLMDLKTLFKNDNVGFTSNRVADDLDSVVANDLKGLSFCLPTKKTIHSWKNESTLKQINEYQNLLKKLLANLPKFYDQDLEKINQKILSCSSKEEMLKIEPKKKRKQNSLWDKSSFSMETEFIDDAAYTYIVDDIFNTLYYKMKRLPDADDIYEAVVLLTQEDFIEVGLLKRIGKKITKIFTKILVEEETTHTEIKDNITYVGFTPEYLQYFI